MTLEVWWFLFSVHIVHRCKESGMLDKQCIYGRQCYGFRSKGTCHVSKVSVETCQQDDSAVVSIGHSTLVKNIRTSPAM